MRWKIIKLVNLIFLNINEKKGLITKLIGQDDRLINEFLSQKEEHSGWFERKSLKFLSKKN